MAIPNVDYEVVGNRLVTAPKKSAGICGFICCFHAPSSLLNEVYWPSASVSGANEVLILDVCVAFSEPEAWFRSQAQQPFSSYLLRMVGSDSQCFLHSWVLSGHKPDDHQVQTS